MVMKSHVKSFKKPVFQQNSFPKMNIEIVGFYENPNHEKNSSLVGTLHVFLIDEGIDIRGVAVFRKNEKWFFYMPTIRTIDPETNQLVRYPVFSFLDMKKKDLFLKTLQKTGPRFVEENLKKQKTIAEKRCS